MSYKDKNSQMNVAPSISAPPPLPESDAGQLWPKFSKYVKFMLTPFWQLVESSEYQEYPSQCESSPSTIIFSEHELNELQ